MTYDNAVYLANRALFHGGDTSSICRLADVFFALDDMLLFMKSLAMLSLIFFSAFGASAQKAKKKLSGASKPECAQGSICFSGEVREGQTFRKELNDDLAFLISLPGGFNMVLTKAEANCNDLFWIANPPFRAHKDTEIDAQYDWTAEQEVETSPREFRFATNCADYKTLYQLWEADVEKYDASLQSLASGQGRLWMTDSKVTHSHGIVTKEQGAIERVKFSVEIKLPKRN